MARFNLPCPWKMRAAMSYRAPKGVMSGDPRQLGEGWSGEKLQDSGTEQSTLILGTSITQAATILPRTSIFLKIYKPKWEEKRQKGIGNTQTTWLKSEMNQKMPCAPQ